MIEKIINAIGLTLITIIATAAGTILGLVLPYGISESLFRFGMAYSVTQIIYWVLMPVMIIGSAYLIWMVVKDYAKQI